MQPLNGFKEGFQIGGLISKRAPRWSRKSTLKRALAAEIIKIQFAFTGFPLRFKTGTELKLTTKIKVKHDKQNRSSEFPSAVYLSSPII